MPYLHGIAVSEKDSSTVNLLRKTAGVPVILGTAPLFLGTAVGNTPYVCHSFEEAKELFGYVEDFERYSLCEAMWIFFKVIRVAPVVFIAMSMSTPSITTMTESHETTEAGESFALTSAGALTENLSISKGGTALTLDTDYTVRYNDEGALVISLAVAQTAGTYSVSGKKYDPSLHTQPEAIALVGNIDKIYYRTGLFPSELVFPYADTYAKGTASTVYDSLFALIEKAQSISDGMFKGLAVVVNSLDTFKGCANTVVLNAIVKVKGKKIYLGTYYAAVLAKLDAENGNVPALSVSNIKIDIDGTFNSVGEETFTNLSTANSLNQNGVVTVINLGGWRFWGNNTAAYPSTSEPKDRWIGSRRFFNWMENRFTAEHFDSVDAPLSYRVIEQLVEDENQYCASLVADGKCAGARIEFRLEDNPEADLLEGKAVFRQYLSPYPPLEYIENVFEFDSAPIVEEFTSAGGES